MEQTTARYAEVTVITMATTTGIQYDSEGLENSNAPVGVVGVAELLIGVQQGMRVDDIV